MLNADIIKNERESKPILPLVMPSNKPRSTHKERKYNSSTVNHLRGRS